MIYFTMGDYETSQKQYERAISLNRYCNIFPSYIIFNKILKVLAKAMSNEKNIKLNEIFNLHENIENKWIEGLASNYIGIILLNINDQYVSEAEDWVKRSVETNQKYGMMWNLANDYVLYAELFKRKGEQSKVKENLNKAIEIFKECGADGWVEKYEKELASL